MCFGGNMRVRKGLKGGGCFSGAPVILEFLGCCWGDTGVKESHCCCHCLQDCHHHPAEGSQCLLLAPRPHRPAVPSIGALVINEQQLMQSTASFSPSANHSAPQNQSTTELQPTLPALMAQSPTLITQLRRSRKCLRTPARSTRSSPTSQHHHQQEQQAPLAG